MNGHHSAIFSIKNLNRIMVFLAVGVLLHMFFVVFVENMRLSKASQISYIESMVKNLGIKRGAVTTERLTVEDPLENLDLGMGNRNAFQPVITKAAGAESAGARTTSQYRLAGIANAARPEDTEVMIENAGSHVTYFLRLGQPVEGLELERILDDSVVVNIGGKSVEIE